MSSSSASMSSVACREGREPSARASSAARREDRERREEPIGRRDIVPTIATHKTRAHERTQVLAKSTHTSLSQTSPGGRACNARCTFCLWCLHILFLSLGLPPQPLPHARAGARLARAAPQREHPHTNTIHRSRPARARARKTRRRHAVLVCHSRHVPHPLLPDPFHMCAYHM